MLVIVVFYLIILIRALELSVFDEYLVPKTSFTALSDRKNLPEHPWRRKLLLVLIDNFFEEFVFEKCFKQVSHHVLLLYVAVVLDRECQWKISGGKGVLSDSFKNIFQGYSRSHGMAVQDLRGAVFAVPAVKFDASAALPKSADIAFNRAHRRVLIP